MALILSCEHAAASSPIHAEQDTSGQSSEYRLSESDFTIGSGALNDWTPTSDASRLGRIQAVVRKQGDAWELTNLGSLLPVTVNGAAVICRASIPLRAGDLIDLGHCRINVTEDAAVQPGGHHVDPLPATQDVARHTHATVATATPAAVPDTAASNAPQSSSANTADAFSDLFGPGTLPLAAPDGAPPVHPFALPGDTHRNAADPLATLAPAGPLRATDQRDPLTWFEPLDRQDTPDVFADQTPSVLDDHRRNHSKT